MRMITSLPLVACLAAASPGVAQTGKPTIRACEVLTKDVVAKFDTGNPKMRDLIPRKEEAIGSHGSSCDDGSIFVQIDPFLNADTYRKSPAKDWQAVSGVGDTAYFHNNRDRYAELMVWSGGHHFTIQLSVPDGRTAEAVKPNTIGIATALIAKLKSM
jgi:hypothetical protein